MSHLRQPALLALLLTALPAGAQQWTADLEAARTRARAKGSDLLLEFTGSDWCVWCKRLRADVFGQEAFLAAVAGRFVLVELDFPHDQSRLPAAVKAQNERLRELFRPNGYPSVFLADAEGRPYGLVGGYVAGGPAAYLARIDALVQVRTRRDEQFAAAAAATGAASTCCNRRWRSATSTCSRRSPRSRPLRPLLRRASGPSATCRIASSDATPMPARTSVHSCSTGQR